GGDAPAGAEAVIHAEADLKGALRQERRIAERGVELERARRLVVEARVPFEPGCLRQRVPRPQPGIQRAVGVVAPVELIEAHPGVQLPAAELQLGFGELAQVAERLRVRNLLLLRDRRTEL